MRQKRLTLSATLLLGIGLTGHAQDVTTASGGNATGSGGSVSYSIGQVVYTTNTGISGSVAQGVQQPYEISVVTSLEEAADIALSMSTYPNPATGFITLKVADYMATNLMYQLFDMNGKLIESKKVENSETRIDMSNLSPAVYFLKVTQGNKEVKIFKIIKN